MKISLIAAFAKERVIGKEGKIPWVLKEDLKHFRNKTEGCSVVMGRKTYESIGRPLSNRLNIVMTRTPKKINGVTEVINKERAIEIASTFSEEIFIIGGERIYEEFLPLASKMYLTEINITSPTCVREIDRALNLDIASDLMDCIQQKLKAN